MTESEARKMDRRLYSVRLDTLHRLYAVAARLSAECHDGIASIRIEPYNDRAEQERCPIELHLSAEVFSGLVAAGRIRPKVEEYEPVDDGRDKVFNGRAEAVVEIDETRVMFVCFFHHHRPKWWGDKRVTRVEPKRLEARRG